MPDLTFLKTPCRGNQEYKENPYQGPLRTVGGVVEILHNQLKKMLARHLPTGDILTSVEIFKDGRFEAVTIGDHKKVKGYKKELESIFQQEEDVGDRDPGADREMVPPPDWGGVAHAMRETLTQTGTDQNRVTESVPNRRMDQGAGEDAWQPIDPFQETTIM